MYLGLYAVFMRHAQTLSISVTTRNRDYENRCCPFGAQNIVFGMMVADFARKKSPAILEGMSQTIKRVLFHLTGGCVWLFGKSWQQSFQNLTSAPRQFLVWKNTLCSRRSCVAALDCFGLPVKRRLRVIVLVSASPQVREAVPLTPGACPVKHNILNVSCRNSPVASNECRRRSVNLLWTVQDVCTPRPWKHG